MKKDIGLRGASRRDFMRGVFTASAALGLGPARALDMLEKMGGSALAQAAAVPSLMFNIVAGNGAVSRMTQTWPVPSQITAFNAATTALNAPTGMPISARYPSTTLPSGNPYYSRVVNGKQVFTKKPWTMFVVGQSQAHSNFPAFAGTPAIITNNGSAHIFSAAAQIQGALHALVPAIAIQRGGMNVNVNPVPSGAPAFSNIPDPQSAVALFSSAASQLMNRLAATTNQTLYSQYYTALMGLTRWAGRPTYTTATGDAQTALGLVVKNLGAQLMVAPGQDVQWAGPTGATDQKVKPLADALIIASNAFKLGLTAQVCTSFANDDPHGHFAGDPTVEDDAQAMLLQSFQDYMDTVPDPMKSGKFLGDRLVMTVHGDTCKDPHQRNGWPDGVENGANILFVQGSGFLPGGWFGDIGTKARMNFDPVTGAINTGAPTAQCTSAACGAVLYAVSGGVKDTARQYYSADLGKLIISDALT